MHFLQQIKNVPHLEMLFVCCRLIASETPEAIEFQLVYENVGMEEARDLRLNITDVPARFFIGLTVTISVCKST